MYDGKTISEDIATGVEYSEFLEQLAGKSHLLVSISWCLR